MLAPCGDRERASARKLCYRSPARWPRRVYWPGTVTKLASRKPWQVYRTYDSEIARMQKGGDSGAGPVPSLPLPRSDTNQAGGGEAEYECLDGCDRAPPCLRFCLFAFVSLLLCAVLAAQAKSACATAVHYIYIYIVAPRVAVPALKVSLLCAFALIELATRVSYLECCFFANGTPRPISLTLWTTLLRQRRLPRTLESFRVIDRAPLILQPVTRSATCHPRIALADLTAVATPTQTPPPHCQ